MAETESFRNEPSVLDPAAPHHHLLANLALASAAMKREGLRRCGIPTLPHCLLVEILQSESSGKKDTNGGEKTQYKTYNDNNNNSNHINSVPLGFDGIV